MNPLYQMLAAPKSGKKLVFLNFHQHCKGYFVFVPRIEKETNRGKRAEKREKRIVAVKGICF
jgi:hypothetical protein